MTTTAVIFDCDGVLVDSEVLVVQIEAELLQAAGFDVSVDHIIDNYVGLSYADMMRLLEERHGRPVPTDLSERIQTDALAAFPEHLQAVGGIADLLRNLGDRPRCVASSSATERIRLSLDVTGLDCFFDPALVLSTELVENGKPAPDIFLLAAEAIGAEPGDCVVLEDSPHGVAGALAAGMTAVGFIGGGHARPALGDRLRAAGAEHVIEHPSDLLALL